MQEMNIIIKIGKKSYIDMIKILKGDSQFNLFLSSPKIKVII